MKLRTKSDYRNRRHLRLRKRVIGTAERPRMSVYVSGRHIYVQFIDDATSSTLAAAGTLNAETKGKGAKNNVATAKALGSQAAEVAKAKGISQVVFDRGGFAYSGRIKALAEAAREAGLKF